MLPELENLLKAQPDTRPPGYGLTFLVRSDQLEAGELLQRLKDVWQVVASWGRWCDEDLGQWPSQEQCLASLPGWFASALRSVPAFEIENWLQDLHDRNWIWWSGAVTNDTIKIDLSVDSMPASFWMLEFVVEKVGGQIVYRGEWKDRRASAP